MECRFAQCDFAAVKSRRYLLDQLFAVALLGCLAPVAATRHIDKLVKCKTILLNSSLKVLAAAVSKDGSEVTIEFEGGGSLLWVTLPSSLVPQMQMIVRELDALAIDARNGVARQWHLPAPDQA